LLSDPTLLAAFETAQNAIDAFAKKTSEALTTANFGEKLKKMAKHVDDLNDKIQRFNDRMEKRMQELVEAIKSEKIANKIDQFINAMDNAIARLGGGGGGGKGKSNAQHGFQGRLMRDTTFSAHAGEYVGISHATPGEGEGGVVVYVNVEGNAIYSRDLAAEVRDVLLKEKRFKGSLGMG
jgi:Asp-tRNA(Asn)/Glu-tRNA(Gln) amidotransferase B subunit